MRAACINGITLALLVSLAGVLSVMPAQAKGGTAITGATLSGGKLTAPRQVPIAIPDNYDPMIGFRELGLMAHSTADAEQLPYTIVLHYELERVGKRDWYGWFDGQDTLYLPQPLIPGWERETGWFKANPLLAAALRQGIGAPGQLPATGDALAPLLRVVALAGVALALGAALRRTAHSL